MSVTRFDLIMRRPLAGGAGFGAAGAYEELKGRLHFAIDPLHSANRRITDVELAPRNPAGRVEWSEPTCRSCCRWIGRGAAAACCVDVVNRGNTVSVPNFNRATRPVFVPGAEPNPPIDVGDGFLMRRGWVVISCGWQCDVPEIAGLYRMQAPEARDAAGQPLARPRVLPAPVRPRRGRLPPLRPRPPRLPRRRSGRARRAAHGVGPARRARRGDPPRAVALRAGGRRPGRARSAPRPPRRRLREGTALPDHVHRRGRAGARALDGGAPRGSRPGSSTAAPPRAIPRRGSSVGPTRMAARRRGGSSARSSTTI